MKRIFSVVISALLFVFSVSAQDYYTGHDRVSADGITFGVGMRHYTFSLDNVENIQMNQSGGYKYKDGTPVEEEFDGYATAETRPGGVEKALMETFSQEEYEALRSNPDAKLVISYVISPKGNTTEVGFSLDYEPCMLSIPPEKYALLEKNLKRYVKWDVNLFGRKLQFMHGMSFVNFSKIRLQYPSSEPEIPDLTVPTGPRNPGDEELKPAPWN